MTIVLSDQPPKPMRPREFGWDSAGLLAVSALSAVSLVWLVFDQLTLASGAFGFGISAYVAWLLIYWAVSYSLSGRLVAKDRVITVVMWSAAAALFAPLLFILYFVISHGLRTLRLHFFLTDARLAGPLAPVDKVGGLHAIIGTLEQNGIALLIGGPAAILTAVFLNEVGGRFTQAVRTIVTAMSGIPSIVAGLFIFSFWVSGSGQGYSGFAGALALAVILLPIVTRTTEEVLRLVPGGLRESSLALGASEWRTTWSVVLPTAKTGIITAVLLGVALTVGETAPLLFTAFGSAQTNVNPFHGPQAALPLVAFTQVLEPIRSQQALGYTALMVLLLLVLVLFILARIAGRTRRGRRHLVPLLWSKARRLVKRDKAAAGEGDPRRKETHG